MFMRVFSGVNFALGVVIIFLIVTQLYKIWSNDLNTRILSYISFLIAYCGISTYNLCKIIDPVYFVVASNSPDTFPLSIGFGLYILFLSFGMTGYLVRLVKSFRQYSKLMSNEADKRINKRISYIYYLTPVLLLLSLAMQLFIIFSILYQSKANILIQCGLAGGIDVIFTSYGLMITFIIRGILSEMKLCLNSNNQINSNVMEIKRSYKKLFHVQKIIFLLVVCAGPIQEIFGVWYYLTRKYDYLFHLLNLFSNILILITINKNKIIGYNSSNLIDIKTKRIIIDQKNILQMKNKRYIVPSVEIHSQNEFDNYQIKPAISMINTGMTGITRYDPSYESRRN